MHHAPEDSVMGVTKEYRRLRLEADEIASEHAKLFDQGHEGVAHCGCKMAQDFRALVAKADAVRTAKREKCPLCGRTL